MIFATSSQRSVVSIHSTPTNVKRQRHPASSETSPPPSSTTTTLSELKPSHETERVTCDDNGNTADRLDARSPTLTHIAQLGTTRFDDDDDEESKVVEEKECFRTQNAAEVLSSLAGSSLGRSSSE